MKKCCVNEPCIDEKFRIMEINDLKLENKININRTININVVFYVKVTKGLNSDLNKSLQKLYDDDINYFMTSLNNCFMGNDPSFEKYKNFNFNNENLSNEYKDLISKRGTTKLNFINKKINWMSQINITKQNINNLDNVIKKTRNKYDVPAIDLKKTLNIWLVPMTKNTGLLGYAQFPWDLSKKPYTDGVVCDYMSIHPRFRTNYSDNKTAIHEIGHWLGLFHTFQTGTWNNNIAIDNNEDGLIGINERTGDCISDTPNQNIPTNGNPFIEKVFPYNNNNPKKLVMYMNYMDYVYDDSMFMFTIEQCQKIYLCLNKFRLDLVVNRNIPINKPNPRFLPY